MHIDYTWLTYNGLPIPRPDNPFHQPVDKYGHSMRLELPSELSSDDCDSIAGLLKILTGRPVIDDTDWQRAFEGPRTFMVLARRRPNPDIAAYPDREIVGMATLVLIDKLSGLHGYVEDVVVHPDAQGHGVAMRLMRRLQSLAWDFECQAIDLTSAPNRIAANALYRKLGYELRETNVYRLSL